MVIKGRSTQHFLLVLVAFLFIYLGITLPLAQGSPFVGHEATEICGITLCITPGLIEIGRGSPWIGTRILFYAPENPAAGILELYMKDGAVTETITLAQDTGDPSVVQLITTTEGLAIGGAGNPVGANAIYIDTTNDGPEALHGAFRRIGTTDSSYLVSARRYYVETLQTTTPAIVDANILYSLCADEDGCKISLSRRLPSGETITPESFHLNIAGPAGLWWRQAVVTGNNADGSSTIISSHLTCRFSDGESSSADATNDFSVYSLAAPGTESCLVIFDD